MHYLKLTDSISMLRFKLWLYSHQLSTMEPNSLGDKAMRAYLNLNALYLTETKVNNAEQILLELKEQ